MPQDNKKPFLKWHDYVAICLIALVTWWVFKTYYGLSPKEQNAQGDALGGLTGPFIALVSAILVYLSFRAQIYANERIQDQLDVAHQQTNFQFVLNQFQELKSMYGSFRYLEYGSDSLACYVVDIVYYDDPTRITNSHITQIVLGTIKFEAITVRFSDLIYMLDELNISGEHKRILKKLYCDYYDEELRIYYDDISKIDLQTHSLSNQIDNMKSISDKLKRQLIKCFNDYSSGK